MNMIIGTSTPTAGRDLEWWLAQAEKFAKRHLGLDIILRNHFDIPAEFPWREVIPVFDSGDITNRHVIKILQRCGHAVLQERDVMMFDGSEVGTEPTLCFINNSSDPDEDTMRRSPNQLLKTGKEWLGLRGYGLAFALYHFATGTHLDPETLTWFPKDRLPGNGVACCGWRGRKVKFQWFYSGRRGQKRGARMVVPAPLKY